MKRIALLLAAGTLATGAWAKLPAPSEDAKAKAAEAAAKTAHANKVADYQLCKSMDKVAAHYAADAKKAGKDIKPPTATPPCTDPGVFGAPVPVAAKPIEAAGAHSPPKTASTPPNTTVPAAAAPGNAPATKPAAPPAKKS
jgi:hypothetical protein